MASKVRSTKEADLIFGVRPEYFREKSPEQEPSTEWPTIRANVNVIEPLGKEISLDVSIGANALTVLLDADTEVKLHQDIHLVLNMEKAHIFKKEEGEAIV
jgi:multiple sugar transport system ATP-binding protein